MHQTELIPLETEIEFYKKIRFQTSWHKDKTEIKNVPTRTNEPKTPQYCGGILIQEVRIDTAASVKKKFQCTPYSLTCTYIKEKWLLASLRTSWIRQL